MEIEFSIEGCRYLTPAEYIRRQSRKYTGGTTIMHMAAGCSDLSVLKQFSKEEPALLNKPDREGEIPFMSAVEGGKLDNVEFFMERADTNIAARDHKKQTVLHYAIMQKDEAVLNRLLENQAVKALINEVDFNGKSPLKLSVEKKKAAFVKILIQNGAEREKKDRLGNSIVHHVAKSYSKEMMEAVLIEGPSKFDINIKGFAGTSPLMAAIQADRIDNMKVLLAHGADIQACNTLGDNVLHIAARYASQKMLEALLAEDLKGLTLEDKGSRGETALAGTVLDNQVGKMKTLLDHGADICTRTSSGNTVLHIAASLSKDILELVLKEDLKGLSLDEKNNVGKTPLMSAIGDDKIENVIFLLRQGADRTVRDQGGNTLLHIAASQSSMRILNLLLCYEEIRELLHTKNRYGEIPLVSAMLDGKKECVDILMEITNPSCCDLIGIGWVSPSLFCTLLSKKFSAVSDDRQQPLQSSQMMGQEASKYYSESTIDSQKLTLEKKAQ